MRLYLEPTIFYFQYDADEISILPKLIFEKAKERKVELVTSALTPLQYLGSIHELFVTRKIKRQTRSDYIFKYSEQEMDLRGSLSYAYPTEEIIDIGISYSLDQDIHHERAIHMATAKASKCDTYVMIDESKDINKKEWKKHFEMIDFSETEDMEKSLEKLSSL